MTSYWLRRLSRLQHKKRLRLLTVRLKIKNRDLCWTRLSDHTRTLTSSKRSSSCGGWWWRTQSGGEDEKVIDLANSSGKWSATTWGLATFIIPIGWHIHKWWRWAQQVILDFTLSSSCWQSYSFTIKHLRVQNEVHLVIWLQIGCTSAMRFISRVKDAVTYLCWYDRTSFNTRTLWLQRDFVSCWCAGLSALYCSCSFAV